MERLAQVELCFELTALTFVLSAICPFARRRYKKKGKKKKERGERKELENIANIKRST